MSESTPRTRILASAIAVLDTQGAEGLTVRNVAAGAGCSTTGVYTHFGGKQGLVDAIFIDGFESFDRALDQADERDDQSLHELGLSYRQWAFTRPTHYQVMFGSAVPEYSPSEDALLRAGHSFDQLVERVGKLTGLRDEDGVRDIAFHVWATVHGYVMLEMLDMFPPSLGSPDRLYENGLDLIARSLTGVTTDR